jgi:hypothetical protein
MKPAPTLTSILLIVALAGCGGKSDESLNSSHSGATGGAAGSSGGASSAAGGGIAVDRTCNAPSDCVVQSLTCCPSCGLPNPSNYRAMNRYSQDGFRRGLCAGMDACPGCDAQVGINTLLATCVQGQCVLLDLLESEVTLCSTAKDCHLRVPECCECGGSTDEYSVVAVSSSSSVAYSSLMCSLNQVCADCAPIYPNLQTECTTGHCRVVQ